ncbi:MAG TPA: ATP-binding protein [Vicinamibacterales bacterium]|jgi:serine/threonine-protein kinase RsbW|nr:ATP-binding protein [Vicinamibacterales bacterium]
MPATLTLTLKNDPSEIGRLVDLLEAFGPQSGLTDDATFKLTLALDEIVANVVRHGFDDDREHRIEVKVTVDDRTVTASVEDDGVEFDPREAPVPDLDLPIEMRKPGGLGMHLVKATMDSVEYRRQDGRNILTVAFAR